MLKHGEAKLPIDKIPVLAKALDADPAHLFRLALEQYWPDWRIVINQIFGGVVTQNETALLVALREASDNRDPEFAASRIQGAIAVLTARHPTGQAA